MILGNELLSGAKGGDDVELNLYVDEIAHLVVGDVTLSRRLFPRFADVGVAN